MSKVSDIRQFAAKYHLTYPVGLENGIANALGAVGIPEVIFINKKGQIVKRHLGPMKYADLVSGIEASL
jgi:hypothetical protein